jgi:hypothetical protein
MLSHLIKGFDKSIENLKQRYISLASFQPFDPEDRKLFEEISDSGKDDSEANSNGIYPSYQKFLDLALVERNALLNDVENFIEDFKAAH